MTKRIYHIVFLLLVVLFFSCCKETITPPLPPVTEKPMLKGSFDNKYTRYQKRQQYVGNAINQWNDTAWINDRIHKQLILWSDKTITNLTYEVSNLTSGNNVIANGNIRLRFPQYILGDAASQTCGNVVTKTNTQIADALSKTTITTLSSDDPLKIWVTVDIPTNSVPGNYSGTIKVKSGSDDLQTFNINLLIVDKTLPNVADWTFHLDIWQFPFQYTVLCSDNLGKKIVSFSDTYYSLIQPFYELLADAGQSSITTYIKDGAFSRGQSMVKWTKNADNTWSFDFTNFNNYVIKMMSWGISKQINAFSLIGWNTSAAYFDAATNTNKIINLDVTDTDFVPVWNSFLTAFKKNLDAKGWFNKTVLFMDEIRDDKMQSVISLIKGNNPNWKIGLAGSSVSAAAENTLYDYSTIYGYNRKSDNQVHTFYTSCSQLYPNNYLTLQNSPAEMPFMAWFAAGNNFNGYLRWAYDYWTLGDPNDIRDGSNAAGDYNMIYRTDNTANALPLSSIRFELLREGIQDFEKIKILNDAEIASYLTNFTNTSAPNATGLVQKGESIIKKISARN